MPDSSDQLDDFWEAVTSDVRQGDQINRELESFSESELRRDAQVGAELLEMLRSLRPETGSENDRSVLTPASLVENLLSSHDNRSEIGGTKIGRYTLVEELGRGGCGAVFRATDTLLDRDVALKIPMILVLADHNAYGRFILEARSAAQLEHPNIVRIHEAASEAGVWYIASEYCPGHNLAQIIKNPSLLELPTAACSDESELPKFPFRLVARIVADLADGLQHAHDRGIIHRDIKPANIMLVRSPPNSIGQADGLTPKLTDFGLAKLIEEKDATMTVTGILVGTVAYMAPEQVDGKTSEIGCAVDIYGLGNVLYELLIGQPPFGRASDLEMLEAIKREPPRRIRSLVPTVPGPLEAITMRCIEKSPQDRFSSAGDVASALRLWLNGDEESGSLPTSWPSSRRKRFRSGLLVVGVAGFLLAILILIPRLPNEGQNDSVASSQRQIARSNPLAIIRRDLVAYLPLSNDFTDASGNAIRARVGGGDPEFTDVVGPAVELDGEDDYVTLDYPEVLRFGDRGSFTVAGWFFLNGDQRHRSKKNPWGWSTDVPLMGSYRMDQRPLGMLAGPIVFEGQTDTAGWGVEILAGVDACTARVIASNGEVFRSSASHHMGANHWEFVCVVFDREIERMSLHCGNGFFNDIPIPPGSIDSNHHGFSINLGADGTGEARQALKARISNLAIWRRPLGHGEVVALWQAGMNRMRALLEDGSSQGSRVE